MFKLAFDVFNKYVFFLNKKIKMKLNQIENSLNLFTRDFFFCQEVK